MAMKDPHPKLLKSDYLKEIGLTQDQINGIAAYYDKEAEQFKTKAINMRVSPRILEEIKSAAQANGYSKYQQWINKVLYDAIAATFPDRYAEVQ